MAKSSGPLYILLESHAARLAAAEDLKDLLSSTLLAAANGSPEILQLHDKLILVLADTNQIRDIAQETRRVWFES
jgi:hypothetical protein